MYRWERPPRHGTILKRLLAILLILPFPALAAAGGDVCLSRDLSFVTNRITPPTLYSLKQKVQWDEPDDVQVLRTEHFDVYMRMDEEALASRIASIAEDWYPRLETSMGVVYDTLVGKRRRIPLVGYTSATRFQVTNTSPGIVGEGTQGFFDLLRGRIVFPYTGSSDMLNHVIRHELVHAFTVQLVESSWHEYVKNRELAKDRRKTWQDLSYVARRFCRASPRGSLPRFVRGTLTCTGDEVGLPPARFGKTNLHPQFFFSFEDQERREKRVSVSIRLTNPNEFLALSSFPDSTIARLAGLIPDHVPGIRSQVQRVDREFPWSMQETDSIFFNNSIDSSGARRHLRRLLSHGSSADTLSRLDGEWASSRMEYDILRIDSVSPDRLGEVHAALAPLYEAVGRLTYTGPVTPAHARRSTKRFANAERELYSWIPPDLRPRFFPLAVMEGVAEFYSSEWEDINDLVLRDVVHHGRLVPFHKLTRSHGYLIYVEGKSFFHWLGEEYGRDKVGLFLRSLYRGADQQKVFEHVFGKRLKKLSGEWERAVRRRYLVHLDSDEEIDEYAEQITHGVFDGPPSASDGRVAYTGYSRGRGRVFVRGRETDLQPAHAGVPGYESLHLGNGNVSLRGDRLAYVALNRGRDEVHIYSVSGDSLVEKFRSDSLLTIESVTLSPDGREIAFAGLTADGQSDLYTVRIGGGRLLRLTNDIFHEKDLDWQETGILYVTDPEKPGRYDIHRIGPGREDERVLAFDRPLANPKEWENGVLFLGRFGEAARNVHLYDPDARSLVQVTHDAIGIKAFDVDGDSLYLLTNQNLRFQIWVAPIRELLSESEPAVPIEIAAQEPIWTLPPPTAFQTAPYERSYGPDIFFLTGSTFYQQTFLGLSDLLGNRKISLFLGSNADQSSDFLKFLSVGATMHFLERRNDYQLGVFRFANDFLTEKRGFFYREEIGVIAGVSHPIDRYRSIGLNLLVKRVQESPLGRPGMNSLGEASLEGILGYDTTTPGPFGYGFGAGILASIIYSVDFEFAPEQMSRSGTALADLRLYFPLWGRWTWASRFSGGYSAGEFPREILIGGSLTLRGYDFLSLEGDRYYLTNHEIRFPMPLRLLLGGFDLFTPLQGAAFIDIGDAWFSPSQADFQGSMGLGTRAGFGGAVLRWDLAKRFLRDDLEDGWESDFFFGWNF